MYTIVFLRLTLWTARTRYPGWCTTRATRRAASSIHTTTAPIKNLLRAPQLQLNSSSTRLLLTPCTTNEKRVFSYFRLKSSLIKLSGENVSCVCVCVCVCVDAPRPTRPTRTPCATCPPDPGGKACSTARRQTTPRWCRRTSRATIRRDALHCTALHCTRGQYSTQISTKPINLNHEALNLIILKDRGVYPPPPPPYLAATLPPPRSA